MAAELWALPAGCEPALVAAPEGLAAVEAARERWAARAAAVGLDAEWQPSPKRGPKARQPAAVLQLAFGGVAAEAAEGFVLDLLALAASPATLAALRAAVIGVLADPRLVKVGFGVGADLKAVALALRPGPGAVQALAVVPPALDLATVPVRGPRRGLAALVEAVLGRRLAKELQASAWGERPLSAAQVRYAAMDAAVLLPLAVSLHRRSSGTPTPAKSFTEVHADLARESRRHTRRGPATKAAKKGGFPENDLSGFPWARGEPRFVCCETVEGLARQLRLCGLDAVSARSACPEGINQQRWIHEQAELEQRLVLTGDRVFFRRVADVAYFVTTQGKRNQLNEVVERVLPAFGHRLDEAKFLSRCVKCNGAFRLLSAEESAERAAEVFSRDPKREIWECRSCRHQ